MKTDLLILTMLTTATGLVANTLGAETKASSAFIPAFPGRKATVPRLQAVVAAR